MQKITSWRFKAKKLKTNSASTAGTAEHVSFVLETYFVCVLWLLELTSCPVIFCGKPRMAWEMYLRMESTHESFVMLQILANDCYRAGHFFYSLKAFDVLERLDPAPECASARC
jgi:hypothetical protein